MNLELKELKLRAELEGKDATILQVIKYLRKELPSKAKRDSRTPRLLKKQTMNVNLTVSHIEKIDLIHQEVQARLGFKINRSMLVRSLLRCCIENIKLEEE